MTLRVRLRPGFFCIVFALGYVAGGFGQMGGVLAVKAGANYTGYRDPLGPAHGPHAGRRAEGAGYFGGIAWDVFPKRSIGLGLEALASVSSAGYEFNESGQSYPPDAFAEWSDRGRRSMRITQIQVPVLLVWRHWPDLRIEAGACLGRLLRASDRRKGVRSTSQGEEELDECTDRTAELASWEFSTLLGFVVEGPHGINFQARYQSGFSDLDAPSGVGPSYTHQLQVGLLVSLHHRRG